LESQWEQKFQETVRHKEEHGRSYVPRRPGPYLALGQWQALQRRLWKQVPKAIRKDREDKLSSLGDWIWDPQKAFSAETWYAFLDWIKAFHSANGHYKVPASEKELYAPLGEMRRLHQKNDLSVEQLAELEGIGCPLELLNPVKTRDQKWERMCAQYEKAKKNGEELSPELKKWESDQRKAEREKKLKDPEMRRPRLLAAGMNFEIIRKINPQEVRKQYLTEWKEYVARTGDLFGRQLSHEERKKLPMWRWFIKCRGTLDKMTPEGRAELEAEGFPTGPMPPQTHCKYGHELTEENTYIGRDGGRRCRICRDERNNRRPEGPFVPKRPLKTHCRNGHEYTEENTHWTPKGRVCKTCWREKARRLRIPREDQPN
jgi:hypothetical protein